MRILILTKKFPYPLKDGESIAIMNLARNYALQENQVSVLSMITPKHSYAPADIESSMQSLIQFETVWVDTSIRITEIIKNNFTSIPYHIKRFISVEFDKALKTILQKKTFDIVQLEGLFLTPYIRTIRQYSQAKVILRSHNIEGMIWKRYAKGEKNILKKLFLQQQAAKLLKYEIANIKNYDAIIPISTTDALFFEAYSATDNIKYVPSGVEINDHQEESDIDFNSLYFIGALDWLPNREGLIWFIHKVLPLLIMDVPLVKFHIAGRNPGKWTRGIKNENIIFYGEAEDARQFIADKFICVVPLLSGSGMKIKILEALSNGKHVVTTPVGVEGLPDEILQYISVADSENAFANKLRACLENAKRVHTEAKEAGNFVADNFDNKKLAAEVLKFYRTLL